MLVAATAVIPPRAGADADTRPATTQPVEIGDYVRRLARDLKDGSPAARYEAAVAEASSAILISTGVSIATLSILIAALR